MRRFVVPDPRLLRDNKRRGPGCRSNPDCVRISLPSTAQCNAMLWDERSRPFLKETRINHRRNSEMDVIIWHRVPLLFSADNGIMQFEHSTVSCKERRFRAALVLSQGYRTVTECLLLYGASFDCYWCAEVRFICACKASLHSSEYLDWPYCSSQLLRPNFLADVLPIKNGGIPSAILVVGQMIQAYFEVELNKCTGGRKGGTHFSSLPNLIRGALDDIQHPSVPPDRVLYAWSPSDKR